MPIKNRSMPVIHIVFDKMIFCNWFDQKSLSSDIETVYKCL